MYLPQGLNSNKLNYICYLTKYLYGYLKFLIGFKKTFTTKGIHLYERKYSFNIIICLSSNLVVPHDNRYKEVNYFFEANSY